MSNNKTYYTIEHWFRVHLKDPYREKALKYAEYYGMSSKKVSSLYEALKQGFIWQYTKENNDYPGYWNNLAQKILINKHNEYMNKQKQKTLQEIINEEMNIIVKTVNSCVTGEQLMSAHSLIDNFLLKYDYLKKKNKELYNNIENFCENKKTKLYLKMQDQLINNNKL